MWQRLRHYLTSSYDELKQVIWPTRQQVWRYTFIVAIAVVVTTAIVALVDAGLSAGVGRYILSQ
ncbi:MAG: hypothetical protein CEO22_296 [Candidatus Berkelbacteria bacterium Gr01-1014_85]|uniref:Protein translocase subunit SecE n=1 Tax=Candidatus Berkelbacteria bacterium Gr01-1014_85 TaxID=2017150 RepID=A0A554JC18_9BACT|nr:MAG: hypothetical protein CEO22_296 [Candidatus Berkelbacteria bacterium Gr01-1014_85]